MYASATQGGHKNPGTCDGNSVAARVSTSQADDRGIDFHTVVHKVLHD